MAVDNILNENTDRIIIDMIIGLLESMEDTCQESSARRYLKGKTSSIFNTQCRQAVYVEVYTKANEFTIKCHMFATISLYS